MPEIFVTLSAGNNKGEVEKMFKRGTVKNAVGFGPEVSQGRVLPEESRRDLTMPPANLPSKIQPEGNVTGREQTFAAVRALASVMSQPAGQQAEARAEAA